MRHQTPIIEYITASFLMHLAALVLLLVQLPKVNTLSKIEVNIVEKPKIEKITPSAASPPKPLKTGQPKNSPPILPGEGKKTLETYAEELKAAVDPIYYRNIYPYLSQKTHTQVLIKLNSEGQILKVSVIKTSGYKNIDQIAIDSIMKANPLPHPPKELIKDGIIWDFNT